MNLRKSFVKISVFSIILVLLGALFCNSKALNLPEHTKEFYINDFAGILNQETKDYVLNQSRALDEKTSAQIVVATVNSLEGLSVEEYGIELARKWHIGGKDKTNGLLILIAPNERQIRVEVGYDLEGKINDSKAGRFIKEYAVPHLKNNDWDNGVHDLYTVILSEIYSEYGMELPETVRNIAAEIKGYNKDSSDDAVTIFVTVVIVAVLVVITSVVFLWRRRMRTTVDGDDYFHGGFGGGGGGFFGGGSGGGGSGGGGFSGFSGGGGGFGGGGASSSF